MDAPSPLMPWVYGMEELTLLNEIDRMDFSEISEQDIAAILGYENEDPTDNHAPSADASAESISSTSTNDDNSSSSNFNPGTINPISSATDHRSIRDETSTTKQRRHMKPSSSRPDALIRSFDGENHEDLQKGIFTDAGKKDDRDHYIMSASSGELRGLLGDYDDKPFTSVAGHQNRKRVGESNNIEGDGGAQGASKKRPVGAPQQPRDHIIAERERRLKLNQFFITLSSMLPDLKRRDKASILESAAKYIKQLQERVQTLEKEATRRLAQSLAVNNNQVNEEEEEDNHHDQSNGRHIQAEIEARSMNENILLKILFKKRKGYLARVLAEIEKLNLNIITTHTVQLCDSVLDITMVAQMEMDFDMKPRDVVKKLRSALRPE